MAASPLVAGDKSKRDQYSHSQCVATAGDATLQQWQPGQDQFNLLGDAEETAASLRLTDGLDQVAAAFWKQPFSLYQSDITSTPAQGSSKGNKNHGQRSFSAAFTFRITNPVGAADDDGQGGDGLTFVVNASDQKIGSPGGGLGYGGMYNSVAVEFDTWNNGKDDKKNGNHVGFNLSGEMRSRHLRKVDQRFNDGQPWYAWVDYEGGRQKLELRLARTPIRPHDALLSKKVKLPWWVGGSQGFVGFTAGTGDAGDRHEILSFDFIDTYAPFGDCDPPEFVSMPLTTAIAGDLYRYTAQATDPTQDDILAYQLLQAPVGMAIDSLSGQVDWQPTSQQIGEHPVSIEVVDSIGLTDQQEFSITVEAASCVIDEPPEVSHVDFSDVSAWQLNGVAAQLTPNRYKVLRLSEDLEQSGGAFLKQAITLASAQGGSVSFSASFGFRLSRPSGISDQDGRGADGLVFVLQSMDSTQGGKGGAIGYGGIERSLGIEFDTWNNGAVDGGDGNHVGVNLNGSMNSIRRQPVSERFNDGEPWYAWVDYDGSTEQLELRLAQQPQRPQDTLLVQQGVDLASILQSETAFVGFTSGTGHGGGRHDVFEFEFNGDINHGGKCGGLAFISTPPLQVTAGQQLAYVTQVEGADPAAQLDYSIISGPDGASFDSAGVLRWTAAAPGTVGFSLLAATDQGQSAQQNFSVTVLAIPNQPPQANDLDLDTAEDTALVVVLEANDPDADTLSYALVEQPLHGVLSGNAPNLLYQPDVNFNGFDQFKYQASDGQQNSNTASVSIRIASVNDAPVASSLSAALDEDSSLFGQLIASDIEGASLTFRMLRAPASGRLELEPDGSFLFTPDADANGADSFQFVANDGSLDSNTATVTLNISAQNDAPVAIDQTRSTNEDAALALTLGASDVDGDALDFQVTVAPAHGVLSGSGNNLSYTPAPDFNGSDQFSFVASDGQLSSNPATVNIEIIAQNDAPNAVDQTLSSDEDLPLAVVLGGSDVEGDALTVEITQPPLNGVLSVNGNQWSYTPNANFSGSDEFRFRVSDGVLTSTEATVRIDINPINDAPVASDQALATNEDQPLELLLVATDDEGDSLEFQIVGQPANGQLSGTAPALTYTPNLNFNGSDQFSFRASDALLDSNTAIVSIGVTPLNDLPLANAQALVTDEDAPLAVVLGGSDADGDTLEYEVIEQPQNGVLSGSGENLLYTPNANFSGADQFQFSVSDGVQTSVAAVVSIQVNPLNDAPLAIDQFINTNEDEAVTVLLTGGDIDGDTLQFAIVDQPTNGVLSGSVANLSYLPNANFNGSDQFTFISNDGLLDSKLAVVSITVNARNDAPDAEGQALSTSEDTPLALLLTGSDAEADALSFQVTLPPANGALSGSGASLIYTPDSDFNGDDQFQFSASDGMLTSAVATVRITVDPVNDVPVAIAQALGTGEDQALTILLSGNDVDGDALQFRVSTAPANGVLSGAPPSLSYAPNADFNGADQLAFVVNDGQLDSAPAVVSIQIDARNDVPVITSAPPLVAQEDRLYAYQVLASDSDGDGLGYSLVIAPAAMSITADGLVSWTPSGGDIGPQPVSLRVVDGNGGAVIQSFVLVVDVAPNSLPEFTSNPTLTGRVNERYQYLLQALDADGDSTDFALESGPLGMTLDATLLDWVPSAAQLGDNPVVVSVSDGTGSPVLQSFSIRVDAMNLAPEITSTAESNALEGQDYRYDVIATDANIGDQLAYSLQTAPAGMTIDPDSGRVTWLPPAGAGSGIQAPNTQCAISQEDVVSLDPSVDLIVLMDESGSMLTEQIWSQEFIAPLDAALRARGVGNGAESNLYGLVGFGRRPPEPRILAINNNLLDEFQHYDAAAGELEVDGQFEDGWAAINFAFEQYPLRENSSKNIILVSDEDRDDLSTQGFPQYALDYSDVLASLRSNNALLNAVLRVNFSCADGTPAFGLDAMGNGYFHKGGGEYGLCTDVSINNTDAPPFGNSIGDYAELAWDTGGAVWSLRDLRNGGEIAEAFSKALKDIKVREIVTSLPAIKQVDLALTAIEFDQVDGSLRVALTNRGLIETTPATLAVYFDTEAPVNQLDSATIPALAPGESRLFIVDASAVADVANAFIAHIEGDDTADCALDNNRFEASLVQLRVTDSGGLFDQQAFAINVTEVNAPPQITSVPVTRVSVGEIYRYQVQANDPDLGDGLRYTLLQGAPGMSIDQLNGELEFKPLAELRGAYPVSVQVQDLAGLGDTQSFDLEVDTRYQPPLIVSNPIYYGVVETLYDYRPSVLADPTAVLHFEILHSVEGLQIDSTDGSIEWSVPLDRLNSYVNVAFKVEDQFGNVDSQHFRLHIDLPNVAPSFVSSPVTRQPNFGGGNYYVYDPLVDDANYYEELSWNIDTDLTGMSVDLLPLSFNGSFYLGPLDRLRWPVENQAELIHEAQSNTHYQCRIATGMTSTSAIVDWSVDLNRRQFAQPLLAPLADTNANGQLDAGDDSFILVATWQVNRQSSTPALHALDLSGNLVWEWDVDQLDWYTIPAIADLDGDLKSEILVKTKAGEIVALDNLGREKWRSGVVAYSGTAARYGAITLADLDADGDIEILFGGSVLDHRGNLLWRVSDGDIGNNAYAGLALAVDLDADGELEVLFNHRAYDAEGNPLWPIRDGADNTSYRSVYFALVNADSDDNPEVVVSSHSLGNDFYLSLLDHDGSVLWQQEADSAGPLNIADADRDGQPEIFNPAELAAYDLSGNPLWQRSNLGTRSARAAALADLNQDGALELLLYASTGFHILDASSGSDLSVPRLNQSFSLAQPLVYRNKNNEAAILFGGSEALYSLTADTGPWPGNAGNRIANQYFYSEMAATQGELVPITAAAQPWLLRNSFQFQGAVASAVDAGYLADLMPLNAELSADNNRNTLNVDVLNRGLARADAAFDLVLRLNSASGVELARQTVPGLNANATRSLSFANLDNAILGQVLHLSVEPGVGISECVTENNAISVAALELTVADKEGLSDRQVFALTVYDVNQGSTFVFNALPDATEGEEYRFSFIGTDEDVGDFVVYRPGNPLPEGATLNEMNGEFIWTPPFGSAGTQNISVRFEDLSGSGRSRSFPLVINPSNQPNTAPVLEAITEQRVKLGETLQLSARAADAEGQQIFYTLLQNPSGMSIDRDSGLIDWTPGAGQAGLHQVRVSATDIRAAEDSLSFSVNVSANTAPEIAGTAPARATVGVSYSYNLGVSDADGDLLTYQLQSGPTGMSLGGNGQLSWLPDASHLPQQQAVIEVSDGQVTLTLALTIPVVESNTAPFITSTPLTAVIQGETYRYPLRALDNESDALEFQLNTAPAGMTIDSVSGLVQWSPTAGDLGAHPVVIVVSDERGGGAQQSYTLVVNDGVSNLPPQITSIAPQFVVEGELFSYTVVASDPDGDSLSTRLTQAPSGSTLNGDTIEWTPATGGEIPRYENFRVEVSDGDNTAYQNFFVAVVDSSFDPLALIATLSIPRSEYDLGELLVVQVAASGPGFIDQNLTINGTPAEITDTGQAYFLLDQPGSYRILFSASNGTQSDSAEAFVSVIDPSDLSFPVVEIQSPVQQETITSKIDIIGTAADDNLRYYQLSYQRADAKTATLLPPQTTSVVDGVLGSFDASLLLNGVYSIALTAVDINGHQSQQAIAVVVDGQVKVGNFSVTLEDLNIPVTGIPVRITRTYDTRRKDELLDFGYGWSIDYQNVQVTETRAPGVAWRLNEYRSGFQNSTINFCVQPLGQPQVVVHLPDGDIETFDVRAEPECQLYIPRIDVQMDFEPTDGTTAALELQGNPVLRLANGNLVEIGEDVNQPVDPSLYKLTTKSGTVYMLDQDFGITRVIDINGNTLTYSDDGILHSSGKSIDFVRDARGRIEKIVDPMGQEIVYDYGNGGDLDASTDRAGHSMTYAYDGDHGLTDLFDPLGRKIVKNFYDEDGRLEAQEDADGRRTEFVHDLGGRSSEVTDRLGRITQYGYDARGNVTSEVDALGHLTTYSYDADDNQTSMTDALGHVSMATWDDQRNQLTATDELGRTTGFTYNQWGKELTITDPKGRTYTNTYDAVGNLRNIRDPQAFNAGSVQLDVKGQVKRQFDTYGEVTEFTYDDDGNKLTETDPLDHVTTFTYDDNGNLRTETVQRTIDGLLTDETTTWEYDAQDRVIKVIDALGFETEMVYDEMGNKVKDIDALDRETVYTYDVYRRLKRTYYPDGTHTSMTYDAEGNLRTETDANGYTTSYEYDKLNRLTVTTYEDGSTTETTYDALGRVLTEKDARGNVTTYEYDVAGQRVKTINELSEETTYGYDLNGNLETMTDARGNSWGYEYDVYDNRTVTTWPDGSSSEAVTDRLGRMTEKTDQNGNRMGFAYDALGRLLEVTDALDNVTAYSYDEVGNKLTQTDAEGRITTWTYDALGRELTRRLPLGQQESHDYDAVGNRERSTDFNNQVTTFAYDAMDRLETITYHDLSSETFDYDNHGNRTAATDRNGATQRWDYDNRHRLERVVDAAGNQIEYDYDAAGNKIEQTTTPVGEAPQLTTYGYDVLSRLETVTDVNGLVTTYGYDENGNRKSVTYPNGNETIYTYDDNNRLTRQTTRDSADVLLADYQYTLDPSGHRLQIDEPGRQTKYTYDDSYRLKTESIVDPVNGDHSGAYEYDKVGNRTYSTINGVQTLYSYDDNDRLYQQSGEVFTHDDNGNTLTKTIDGFQSIYTYDAKNHLASALLNEGGLITSSTYRYDVDGIRIGKTEGTQSVDYLVDHNRDYAQVIRESDGLGASIDYLYGDDLIQQSQDSANERYFLYDGLGSTRLLSDGVGAITDRYDYEAFGSVIYQDGTTENSYQFAGEQYDEGLDQYYLRARYYDQSVGRFTQMDSWMGCGFKPLGLNKYIYGEANPVMNIDPSGRFIASLAASPNTVATLARSGSALTTAKKIIVPIAAFATVLIIDRQLDVNWTIMESNSTPKIKSEADRVLYQKEWDRYHKRCDEKEPPGMSPCQKWKWRLRRNKDCVNLREEFGRKWFDGFDDKHLEVIEDLRRGIANLEDKISRFCD